MFHPKEHEEQQLQEKTLDLCTPPTTLGVVVRNWREKHFPPPGTQNIKVEARINVTRFSAEEETITDTLPSTKILPLPLQTQKKSELVIRQSLSQSHIVSPSHQNKSTIYCNSMTRVPELLPLLYTRRLLFPERISRKLRFQRINTSYREFRVWRKSFYRGFPLLKSATTFFR